MGQIKVDDKSNEITAISKLLDALDVEGCIVTIDAMRRQKKIAKKIRAKKAHYILAVKGNQKELHENIIESMKLITPDETHSELDAGHGRIERRICRVYRDLSLIKRE